PVVLVDGRVAGVWSQELTGRRLVVRCKAFRALPKTIRTRVEEEADDLARFLDAAKVDVAFR
ncbi:MAG TPA: crosslink repair DNA glycosylase YcaQ family protein, partial [Thermoplasmata archaeon]|nr:crosslink repair DNA glycosylase YcaQ family protein [Thermoplasmata archaeon]